MKGTPFGPVFMAFHNDEFGTNKGLKSNISVLKIVDHWNRNSRCFDIRGKKIQLIMEDVVLIFGLPIERDDFIMNNTCTLKDRGVIKDYLRNVKITKISIEDALDDLLVKKRELN